MEAPSSNPHDPFFELPVFEIPQKAPPSRMSYEETIRASEEILKSLKVQEEPHHEAIPRFEM